MDDLLREFLSEAFETMTRLDRELLRLERNPHDPELVASIFRLVHTIKGTCGFLDLSRLGSMAHAVENVLGKLRDCELAATPAVITLLLEALDRIKDILDDLAHEEVEPIGDDGALIAALNAIADRGGTIEASWAESSLPPTSNGPRAEQLPGLGDSATRPAHLTLPSAETTATAGPRPPPFAAGRPTAGGPTTAGGGQLAETPQSGAAERLAAQTLRVPVELLEQLMMLVGELVLTRNQLLQSVLPTSDPSLKAPLQRLDQIAGELHEGVTRTRMQAIGTAWRKLPRLIRDLALDLGKEIELEMQGAETRLDRQVLEIIKDPLTHMVRNAVDHGIEQPTVRTDAGKPTSGKIGLNARQEGDHIIIEISDDGRGLDTRRIAEAAIARDLAREADIAAMADRDIQRFVFHPGFSTAETVTAISGRGVGMDVVRTNIERIGGAIDIRSTAGLGSVFTIKIPLTLAIVSAQILEAGGERFALARIGLVELVRIGKHSQHRVETLAGVRALRVADRLLPLASLAKMLGLATGTVEQASDGGHVVLVRAGSRVFGLEVDRLLDSEEIVVKPVPPILRSVSAFSGDAILRDGSMAMILDPHGLAAMLDAKGEATERRLLPKGCVATDERVSPVAVQGWERLAHGGSSRTRHRSRGDRW
jgi:two-component system chemotaxis sensor kinase CheA